MYYTYNNKTITKNNNKMNNISKNILIMGASISTMSTAVYLRIVDGTAGMYSIFSCVAFYFLIRSYSDILKNHKRQQQKLGTEITKGFNT